MKLIEKYLDTKLIKPNTDTFEWFVFDYEISKNYIDFYIMRDIADNDAELMVIKKVDNKFVYEEKQFTATSGELLLFTKTYKAEQEVINKLETYLGEDK